MAASPSVLVVGSVNQDITVRVQRFPAPGETLPGSEVAYALGGKGANQAVASARTGTSTALLATIGDDPAGQQLLDWLADRGVDTTMVRRGSLPTGTAHILVDDAGENQIVVVPGANGLTDAVRVDEAAAAVADAAVVVLQGEVPVATIERAIAAAGGITVLNLAPVVVVSPGTLAHVDFLVVNEAEAGALLGAPVTEADALLAADELAARCRGSAVITLGAAGAVWSGADRGRCPAPVVQAVDTTGAGDAFVGVLAAAVARGLPVADAVRCGIRAASRSVVAPGAALSYPMFDLS